MTKLKTGNLLDFSLLLLVAIVWGTSYGIAKTAILYYPILGFIALRFILTCIIFSPAGFKLSYQQLISSLKIGIPLGLILLAIFIAETYGLAHTSASNSAFLISLYIVFTPFIQWIILKERPSRRMIIATILSLFGAFLLSVKAQESFQFNLGDWLIILAAALRGVMVTLTKKLTQNKPEISSIFLTCIQAGVVGISCLVLTLVINFKSTIQLPQSSTFWLSLGYLVIFCTLFAFFVQNFTVRRSSPAKVSLLMGTEPVWGALYAVFIMHESLSIIAWCGGLIIVLASLWASIKN